jgi:hypothetical protein
MDDHTGAIRCTFCWSAFSEPLLRCRQSGTSAKPPMLLLVWLLTTFSVIQRRFLQQST